MQDEKFTLFFGGPLSQWYGPLRDRKTGKVADDSRFLAVSVEYNCAEQYMMASKARLFGDEEMQAAILAAGHPRDQKALGRKVKGFVKEEWEDVAQSVVYMGNYHKFTQNQHLMDYLLSTAGTTLVECNPRDRIWGVGLGMDDPRALSRETWRGTNLLGEVLTKVRDDLMAAS